MNFKTLTVALAAGSCLAFAVAPASAARVVTAINADLSSGAYTFANQGAGFTFGFNGDYYGGGPVYYGGGPYYGGGRYSSVPHFRGHPLAGW